MSSKFNKYSAAAKGVVLDTKKYHNSLPVNIGTLEETSIQELVSLIVDLTNFQGEVIYDSTKPSGHKRRCADVSLAKKKFNFEAKYTLLEGLKETMEWYKTHV